MAIKITNKIASSEITFVRMFMDSCYQIPGIGAETEYRFGSRPADEITGC
jgi:hypothetical protein